MCDILHTYNRSTDISLGPLPDQGLFAGFCMEYRIEFRTAHTCSVYCPTAQLALSIPCSCSLHPEP